MSSVAETSAAQWRRHLNATIYVLSGVAQALIMTVATTAGLASPTCQLYMLFYCLGPATVLLPLLCSSQTKWPSLQTATHGAAIALIDVGAGSLNYTGLTLCGPTYFAIIYSSVTIWAAVFSYLILHRGMNHRQWGGVVTVFVGLVLTSLESASVGGPAVFRGSLMVVSGSAVHASVYVLSEWIMTRGRQHEERLSVSMNCAVQSVTGFIMYGLWQVVYTRKHFHELVIVPAKEAGTSIWLACAIFVSIAVANWIHSVTFYYTLKAYPGGSTSAGVMKGLQAVLVFVVGSWVFCGTPGTGKEMCFSGIKFLSLFVVLAGIVVYTKATPPPERDDMPDARATGCVTSSRSNYDATPEHENEISLHGERGLV